jgi:nitrate/nitrite transporter NarK
MTLCMGILSAMTTGFWGAVSDRLGRTKVMSIAVLGLVMR